MKSIVCWKSVILKHPSLTQVRFTSTALFSSKTKSKTKSENSIVQINLDSSVSVMKGVGGAVESLLNKMNIFSVGDLLFHFPVNIINWNSYHTSVDQSHISQQNIYLLTFVSFHESYGSYPHNVVCKTEDNTIVNIVYFNFSSYLKFTLRSLYGEPGNKFLVRGKLQSRYKSNNQYQITNPEVRPYKTDTMDNKDIEVIYRTVEGLSTKKLKSYIDAAILIAKESFHQDDWLKPTFKSSNHWHSTLESIINIHNPTSIDSLTETSVFHERLAFDELVIKQIADINNVIGKEKLIRNFSNLSYSVVESTDIKLYSNLTESFFNVLPYKLTSCQLNALSDIYKELASPMRMKKILYGDVGSGKSVVAYLAMLYTVQCGKQTILLAPTEILADQHFNSFQKSLNAMYNTLSTQNSDIKPIKVGFLSSSIKGKKREQLLNEISDGEVKIVIGTHALLTESIVDIFDNIGLVVIDEEQRFGVEQRNKLADRGANLLSTSATPIPRTHLQFLQYEYTISSLFTKPLSKRNIETIMTGTSLVHAVIERLQEHVKFGTKIFWVTPSINPVAASPGTSALERFELLSSKFEGKVSLIHGQMSSIEKETVMKEFANSDSQKQILVSTSIIEVGIDIPDVSICIIDRAENFGLSQLHQMRGRIGRGKKPTEEKLDSCYCMLLFNDSKKPINIDNENDDSKQYDRLQILVNCSDGLEIAEADLKLRGPGDIFGTKQSGQVNYRVASLPYHSYLLESARVVAQDIVYSRLKTSCELSGHILNSEFNEDLSNCYAVSDPRDHPLVRALFISSANNNNQPDTGDYKLKPSTRKVKASKLTSISDSLYDEIKTVNADSESTLASPSLLDSNSIPELDNVNPAIRKTRKLKTLNNDESEADDLLKLPCLSNDNCLEIVMDLETTGFSVKYDRIIQIAAKVVKSSSRNYKYEPVEGHSLPELPSQIYNAYVNPGRSLSAEIVELTGITQEFLRREGISFEAAWNDFILWLESVVNYEMKFRKLSELPTTSTDLHIVLIAHNGKSFDYPFLENEISRSQSTKSSIDVGKGIKTGINLVWGHEKLFNDNFWLLDTLLLLKDKNVSSELQIKSYGLASLYELVSGSKLSGAHNALADISALETVLNSSIFKDLWRLHAKNKLFRVNSISRKP